MRRRTRPTGGRTSAGTLAGYDIRSSLFLSRNKDKPYLMQGSSLCDVKRNPRTSVSCYELR